ncbi:MAG: segregation/condensation protein A [Firmicutes bacterium]|nr:segregation/condensation protein A [Bacillota bacterium]
MNYKVTINDFEGPLDLLLHLVKETKMDIYEVDMSIIIEQYLKYIENMQNLNIDIASEFLVMAAELIHLKSKMLINIKEEVEETDEYSINTEEDLKNKLIEYEKFKNVSELFKNLEESRKEVFTKVPENLNNITDSTLKNDGSVTLEDLLNAFLEYRKRLEYQKPINTKITKKELSVSDRRKAIRNILDTRKKVEFTELFESTTKDYVVVTFLAILDMSKNDEITLMQKNNFDKIMIEKR